MAGSPARDEARFDLVKTLPKSVAPSRPPILQKDGMVSKHSIDKRSDGGRQNEQPDDNEDRYDENRNQKISLICADQHPKLHDEDLIIYGCADCDDTHRAPDSSGFASAKYRFNMCSAKACPLAFQWISCPGTEMNSLDGSSDSWNDRVIGMTWIPGS